MGRQMPRGGARGRSGNGLVAGVDKWDELADLRGDLIGLCGRPRLVATGIAKGRVGFGRVWQALMGEHGPKDVLMEL